MNIHFVSFGYHYGIPDGLDAIFDVRHLKNPHNSKQLRELNGLDKDVQDMVIHGAAKQDGIIDGILGVVYLSIYHRDESITIGIGCTGGRHRSVAIAEHIKDILSQHFTRTSDAITVTHRDIERKIAHDTISCFL